MKHTKIPTGPMAWRVDHGDSIDLLRAMPPDSVDSIVQDPPAGIDFMGKKWDRKTGYVPVTDAGRRVTASLGASNLPAKMRASLRSTVTASILRWSDDNNATGVIDLDAACAMALSAVAEQGLLEPWEVGFLAFMTDVFVEQLRVAKPGAHSLSWALPRTSDLTMMALRFAGWDVRETVSHWFGGSMPKSFNVSKGGDAVVDADREVVGSSVRPDGTTRDYANQTGLGRSGSADNTQSGGRTYRHAGVRGDITAPATDFAREHDGRGTALAPGHELWILARKPLGPVAPEDVRELLGTDHWWTRKVVHLGDAKKCKAAGKRWPDHAAQMTADAMANTEAQRVHAARRLELARVNHDAVTAAMLARPDDRETLTAYAEETAASALADLPPPTLATWSVHSGRPLAKDITGILSLRRDGVEVARGSAPKYSAAPLVNVVANVARWGTGAIEIDGCRTDLEASANTDAIQRCQTGNDGRTVTGNKPGHTQPTYNPSGRWPKSAVLSCALACEDGDHVPWCVRAMLDAQSGTLTSGAWDGKRHTSKTGATFNEFVSRPQETPREVDSGGASRFFPAFDHMVRYCAKASDRTVPDGSTNKHPTFKNSTLMEWLIRLVTPRGGVVLDSFNGSGSTGVAAMAVGVRYLGHEQNAEHVRVSRARIAAAGSQLGLFT